jgi:hypothetical protein|tara:strand:- start:1167 stop:1346 length:180 start_codon:yes stop_codon:yes gene_type:complete
MSKELIVEKKNVFGQELVYPICENAKRFALLTGQKTLSSTSIIIIKRLGFTFKHAEIKI